VKLKHACAECKPLFIHTAYSVSGRPYHDHPLVDYMQT
jgi:hypothetical protein